MITSHLTAEKVHAQCFRAGDIGAKFGRESPAGPLSVGFFGGKNFIKCPDGVCFAVQNGLFSGGKISVCQPEKAGERKAVCGLDIHADPKGAKGFCGRWVGQRDPEENRAAVRRGEDLRGDLHPPRSHSPLRNPHLTLPDSPRPHPFLPHPPPPKRSDPAGGRALHDRGAHRRRAVRYGKGSAQRRGFPAFRAQKQPGSVPRPCSRFQARNSLSDWRAAAKSGASVRQGKARRQ